MPRPPQLVRIDCGANRGLVLEEAARALPHYRHIAFEANPYLQAELHALRIALAPIQIDIHHAAVWTEDGHTDFYLTDPSADPTLEGATLMPGKTTASVNYAAPVRTPCIDLDRFLRESFDPKGGDTVILKMDIEGAEYDVLERMIARGSIHLIAALLVETHAHKIPSIPASRHDKLLADLTAHFGRPFLRDSKHIAWSRPGVPSPALHVRNPARPPAIPAPAPAPC